MLIHHFEAEKQGFQGLLTKMTEGNPKSPKNPIFWKKHFLRGFLRGEYWIKATSSPIFIINENIFVFDLAGGPPEETSFS